MVSIGKLSSKTCRNMMTWSHNAFQRKLVSLAHKYTDVKVRLCNEAFSTRQCGRCGVVNRDMTSGTALSGVTCVVFIRRETATMQEMSVSVLLVFG